LTIFSAQKFEKAPRVTFLTVTETYFEVAERRNELNSSNSLGYTDRLGLVV